MKDRVVLLSDEIDIPAEEIIKRGKLGKEIIEHIPKEVFRDLSVFQPSVGCLNCCSFCSQEAGSLLRMLDGKSIRTLAGGIRFAMSYWDLSAVTSGRRYKPGIIFPYLDNDIGSYPYLIDYLVSMDSLGAKVRISSVGWSRKNQYLNEMHREIVKKYSHMLAGIRFSLTPYSIGWRNNRDEFVKDFTNSLLTYQSLLGLNGSEGTSGACIDLCFSPDVRSGNVQISDVSEYRMIQCHEYTLFMPLEHSEEGIAYQVIGEIDKIDTLSVLDIMERGFGESVFVEKGKASQLHNEDGPYYAFISDESQDQTDGIFYFPGNEKRHGGIFDARWPLRDLRTGEKIKAEELSSYDDVEKLCYRHIDFVKLFSAHRASYLKDNFLPILLALRKIFEEIGLPPEMLFDSCILRDRGMIRNSGRAYYEFREIASGPNIMVVPDPVLCSKSTDEVWRIFPAQKNSAMENHSDLGGKSLLHYEEEQKEAKLVLNILAVDPPSHSNYYEDGSPRRAFCLPIDDFVNPLQIYSGYQGKQLKLLPGL